MTRYTVESATEWGLGRGPNGTGRREKVSGFYVVRLSTGKRIRAFTGKNAEQQAHDWAKYCAEHFQF
jgi:hypothetical protein